MFKTFNSKIQYCSDVEYIRNPTHICINRNKCHIYIEPEPYVFSIRLKKITACPSKNKKVINLTVAKVFVLITEKLVHNFILKSTKLVLNLLKNAKNTNC